MCESLQNSVMMLSLDFMPPYQISNMSLNGLRRRVVICDKTLTETQMDEPSIALDPWHQVSSSGALHYHFVSYKIVCWRITRTRVFLNEAQCNF
jgi:hypothetical protein